MKHILFALSLLAACQNAPAATSETPKSFSVSVSGAGQPMLLIPGLESSGEVWNGVVEHYKTKYQLRVITIAGFAGQPAVPGLDLVKVKDDLIRYIREEKLDRLILVGHSLGGFLSLWIAASIPDRIDKVVSVDGLPFLPAMFDPAATVAESTKTAEQMRGFYATMKPEQLEKMSKMSLSQMISDPKNVETATEWAAHSESAFVGQAVYDLMTTDLREEIAKVRAPVLLIGAGKAVASNPEKLAAMRATYEKQVQRAPKHTVVLAENALHFVMWDDPAFLLGKMDKFLTTPEGGDHGR